VPLIAGGALVVALVAVTTARQAPPSTAPASPAPVASALPAGLPAGEIQSVVERNGGKVIVVRPAQPAPVADSPAADGMKAYVDPASRRLSEGSAEEHAALNAKIATQQRALRQRALVSEQAVVGQQGEQGGYYAQVPDSAMVYTVAHQAGDTVVVDHEQGGENAVKNMKAGSRKAAGKEHRDDR
jgi:hypothetical protein